MKRTARSLSFLFLITPLFPARSVACCVFVDRSNVAKISSQSNLIFFDSNAGVEHFIRKAKFEVAGQAENAKSLGFVAPTPSVPAIEEVNEKIYQRVSDLIAAERAIRDSRAGRVPFGRGGRSDAGAIGGVRIVQTVQVCGYTAQTVVATDSASLSKWVRDNDYGTIEAADEWFDFYLEKKWYLTLFKLNKVQVRSQTGAIKMSFRTDRIYNPFYVPKGNSKDWASLDITLVTDNPVVGKVGRQPWIAPYFGMTVGFKKLESLCRIAKVAVPESETTYLTQFHTWNFGKDAKDDLFFDPIYEVGKFYLDDETQFVKNGRIMDLDFEFLW